MKAFIKAVKITLPIFILLSLIYVAIWVDNNDRQIIETLNIEVTNSINEGEFTETTSGKIVDRDGMSLGVRLFTYTMIPILIISIYKISKTED